MGSTARAQLKREKENQSKGVEIKSDGVTNELESEGCSVNLKSETKNGHIN